MAYGLLYDYLTGQCIEGYKYFGAHFIKKEVEVEIDVPLKKIQIEQKRQKLKDKLMALSLDFMLL